MFLSFEPFYGWVTWYDPDTDDNSPFYGGGPHRNEEGPKIYNFPAHPDWDDFGSESLLTKILFADYSRGYVVIEFLGYWNDLLLNDFKMLAENVLTWLIDGGIRHFIFLTENVFNIWLGSDDYYEALQEEIEDGWICILKGRKSVLAEIDRYGIDRFLYRSSALDNLQWRKLKPWDLFDVVNESISRLLKA